MAAVASVSELYKTVGYLAKQITVMRYKNYRTSILLKSLLDSLLCREVEVVCRLVKNENISVFLHHYRKTKLCALAAADNSCFLENVFAHESDLRKQTAHFKFGKGRIAAVQFLHNGKFAVEVSTLLLKVGYLNVAVPANYALMRQFFLYNTQER